MIRVLTRGLVVAAVIGVVATGSAGTAGAAHGARFGAAADTDWSIMFPYWNPTQPWIIEESYNSSTSAISGPVTPPNPNCPGTMTGTWNQSSGAVSMTITYSGTCKGETSVLTGQQNTIESRGTATDNNIGVTSRYDGEPQTSMFSASGGAACPANAACHG